MEKNEQNNLILIKILCKISRKKNPDGRERTVLIV